MSYTPYLIANPSTGLDQELQPWLIPDDAQAELLDGFVYRGVLEKRQGYNYYATGEKGGAPYTESRIVRTVTNENKGVGNGTVGPYVLNTTNFPIRRESLVITAGAQVVTDDGLGVLQGNGTGTINYRTGAVNVTFNVAVGGATTIFFTYVYFPGNPVMMIANFYTSTNIRELIVADTEFVNRYNSTTNRFDDISPALTYTGNSSNFFSWVNYTSGAGVPRLLFSNNVDPIQSYDGLAVTNYAYTLSTGNPPVPVTTLTCLLMFEFKDRLLLLRTTENGTIFPKRIRISGTGANADVFDTTATGAGVIDIPDETWINGAAFNRDQLVIFTEASTWTLSFTGNDVTPFILKKLDESRGSGAPFAAITYLNRTTTASPRGLIITDGYNVERMDNKIPDYSFNKIDPENFVLCFAGAVDEDRDHYLIHPVPNESPSTRILVTNYEEDNFSVYRIPLSCMGNYLESFDITWNDLLVKYPDGPDVWDVFGTDYKSWNAFGYTRGTPISLGGGHNGEIWRLNVDGLEDNPLRIRNITYPDPVNSPNLIDVETDFNNYQVGDYIFFVGNSGLTDINNKQYAIISFSVNNFIFRVDKQTLTTDAWTGTTIATTSRVIPFESTTKQFNPFSNQAAKVKCGWLYFYVSTTDTFLTDLSDNPVPAKILVEIITDDNEQPIAVTNFNVTPFSANATNLTNVTGSKKWTKIWINQTARFIQFRVKNTQAGANIKIHAMMPGFAPTGRLI